MTTKALIAYCHRGTIHASFSESLIDLLIYEAGRKQVEVQRTNICGGTISDARNAVVEAFLGSECQWLLFLDSDMVFPANLLETLLSASSEDRRILAGCYLTYLDNHIPKVVWLERRSDGKLYTVSEVRPDSVVSLQAVGMGGTLIHRSVLESFPKSDDSWRWFGHDLVNGNRIGEDITFCLRAEKLGFKSFGVGAAQMGHNKNRILDIDALLNKQHN